MDPRASITAAGLARQFTLATKIADLMNRTYAAARTPEIDALNADLATAYDAVEGADRVPTVQAAKTAAALDARVRRLLSLSVR